MVLTSVYCALLCSVRVAYVFIFVFFCFFLFFFEAEITVTLNDLTVLASLGYIIKIS